MSDSKSKRTDPLVDSESASERLEEVARKGRTGGGTGGAGGATRGGGGGGAGCCTGGAVGATGIGASVRIRPWPWASSTIEPQEDDDCRNGGFGGGGGA